MRKGRLRPPWTKRTEIRPCTVAEQTKAGQALNLAAAGAILTDAKIDRWRVIGLMTTGNRPETMTALAYGFDGGGHDGQRIHWSRHKRESPAGVHCPRFICRGFLLRVRTNETAPRVGAGPPSRPGP